MADKKITGLTENSAPALADLLHMIDAPASAALNQKVTFQTVFAIAWLAAMTSGYHASQDELLIVDNGTPKRTNLPDLFAGIEDFLSELAAVPALTDNALVVDGGVAKYISWRNLIGTRYVQVRLVEATTDLTVTDKVGSWYLHIPPELDGLDLVYCHAEVDTAGTTGTQDFQIHNIDNALDMLTTKLTIDSGETGSDTAATAYSINTSNDHVNENDKIRIDSDAIQTTAAKGLVITLGFR